MEFKPNKIATELPKTAENIIKDKDRPAQIWQKLDSTARPDTFYISAENYKKLGDSTPIKRAYKIPEVATNNESVMKIITTMDSIRYRKKEEYKEKIAENTSEAEKRSEVLNEIKKETVKDYNTYLKSKDCSIYLEGINLNDTKYTESHDIQGIFWSIHKIRLFKRIISKVTANSELELETTKIEKKHFLKKIQEEEERIKSLKETKTWLDSYTRRKPEEQEKVKFEKIQSWKDNWIEAEKENISTILKEKELYSRKLKELLTSGDKKIEKEDIKEILNLINNSIKEIYIECTDLTYIEKLIEEYDGDKVLAEKRLAEKLGNLEKLQIKFTYDETSPFLAFYTPNRDLKNTPGLSKLLIDIPEGTSFIHYNIPNVLKAKTNNKGIKDNIEGIIKHEPYHTIQHTRESILDSPVFSNKAKLLYAKHIDRNTFNKLCLDFPEYLHIESKDVFEYLTWIDEADARKKVFETYLRKNGKTLFGESWNLENLNAENMEKIYELLKKKELPRDLSQFLLMYEKEIALKILKNIADIETTKQIKTLKTPTEIEEFISTTTVIG